jgi:hypothetical protein
MSRNDTVGTHRTTVTQREGVLIVTYHATAVVVASPSIIRLDTGGYFTRTTKVRMNQASVQFDLGYKVYQNRGSWFVDTNGTTIPFDGDSVEFAR